MIAFLLQFLFLHPLLSDTGLELSHSRGFPEAHGVVALAHNLFACSIQKLGQPANAAHKEAGVDVEENDGWVAVRVSPVGEKRGLIQDRREMVTVCWKEGKKELKPLWCRMYL